MLTFSFALSWLWIIVGMLVRTPESVMTTSFVFLMPLTFASDIFVDLATMPGWLQAVVGRNPVTYLANASRSLMHGQPAGGDVLWTLAGVRRHRARGVAHRDAAVSQGTLIRRAEGARAVFQHELRAGQSIADLLCLA